ncbi:tRNA(Met) cytidine acetyltransferase TmcA [Paraglaciecola marina]|uniref:tRNA(Met) cytidine acetyltransferase TmcA n=1 Tax=Paraglaciecola marina TaxID=2500157 RepID=UPI00105C99F3|nr:GNAT family N-acetyltransferase [Paraglaciecola marina]
MNSASQLSIWLQKRNEEKCHRQLLVISGNRDWVSKNLSPIIQLANEETLWVGSPQLNIKHINIKDYRSRLGQEHNYLILDCFEGFRANAAMALSGTIKAGGLMIILCPDFEEWKTFADPENINRISYGLKQITVENLFYDYLSSAFLNDPSVAMLTEQLFRSPICISKDEHIRNQLLEQENAVQLVCKHAHGRANRPLLLTADRGRGKSSALGLAAAKLMQMAPITIWVSAPLAVNIEQVFKHAKKSLPSNIEHSKYSLKLDNSTLIFKPIDQLLLADELPNVIFVDEAAAIPIHILTKLLQKFPRIIFSSTSHGYEGSGRGFEIKFTQQLKKLKPNYKRVHLKQPIRWYNEDVLESFWFNTMFYDYKAKTHKPNDNKNFHFRKLSKSELLKNNETLEQIFQLLLNAHYQTSPDDLQRLLDSPDQTCFVLMTADNIIGVVQVIEEGGENLAPIKNEIASCYRRVKGHLVSQQLTAQYNIPELSTIKQWRISRIAIDAKYQRRGLGLALLTYLEQYALKRDIGFLSAAFGANSEMITFWKKANFDLVHLGQKPEISSGEYNCICIKTLKSLSTNLTPKLTLEFSDELRFNLNKTLKSLPTDIALALILSLKAKKHTYNEGKLDQFLRGNRQLSTCLRDVYLTVSSNLNYESIIGTTEALFLTAMIFQSKTYEQLAAEFNLTGKKQIEVMLRQSIKKLL